MVEFETIKSEEIKFGNNNFIEVARKKAITPEGENVFISLARGFFTPDGERRFKRSFAIPDDKEVVDFVSDGLKKMTSGEVSKKEKPAKKETAKEKKKEAKPKEETVEKTEEEDED